MPERDPFQTLWTQDTEDPFTMSLADIHTRATKFQSRIRTRNVTEYAAAALVIGIFGWMAFIIPVPVVKAGCALIILGALYICWKLHSMASARRGDELDAAASLADYHRAELVRQRDALSTVWRWYLAPLVPGMLLFNVGTVFTPENPMPLLAKLASLAFSLGIIAAVFAGIAWLNARAVRKLDKEIAGIDQAVRG